MSKRDDVGSIARSAATSRDGKLCPGCGRPLARCSCRAPLRPGPEPRVCVILDVCPSGVQRTRVSGLPLGETELGSLALELGRACGTSSSVVGRSIELDGDHQSVVARALEGRGYRVDLA